MMTFEECYARYGRLVYACVWRMTHDQDAVQELGTTALTRIWRGLPHLTDERNLPAWVCRVTRHVVYDAMRQARHPLRLASVSLEAGAFAETLVDEASDPQTWLPERMARVKARQQAWQRTSRRDRATLCQVAAGEHPDKYALARARRNWTRIHQDVQQLDARLEAGA